MKHLRDRDPHLRDQALHLKAQDPQMMVTGPARSAGMDQSALHYGEFDNFFMKKLPRHIWPPEPF